MPPIVNTV